uniref:Kinesin motor domain-containing protein n=1 Tax=Cyprinus carpio carpio TaxID=630221 RepID=A0A9J7XHL6_CYPCA
MFNAKEVILKNIDGNAIKVFVRVRPLTQGTGLMTDGDHSLCLTVSTPHTVRLHCKPEPRTFTYDHVADMNTSQEEVFSSVAKNIVESCMNGYNGTIFAYGQTGSGKTFTMLGPSELDNFSDELRGVIPRSFEYLFFLINREVERSGGMKSFLCKCSFIEIYNEQIYDLLDSVSTSLFLREDIKRGVFVEGAVEKYAASAAEAYQVLSMGWRNRRVASTSMNRESSRSHAVFTMTLESKETAQEVVNIRTSQLNLVDLAGSERQRDTHAEGSRLKEASSINRSLMCLGQVIMALMDVSNGKNRHICYRDSKLTFLLRDSLGGNAKTYIIANVHPGSKCFGETLSTLQFAQRAKLIKNKAMVNEDTQGNVRQLQAEVRKLKEQLAHALSQAGVIEVTPSDQQTAHSEVSYKTQFIQAMSFWKKAQEEKKALQGKVSQLEAAWAQKEKFIQSSRMILKFRDDHISQLKKELQSGQRSDPDQQNQQLQEEIRLLREQVEHHPRMMRYAAENCALREEVRALRALDSVRSAVETKVQSLTALEKTFLQLLEMLSSVSVERMKVQLLQKQSELTATIQAFEEFKHYTPFRKQLAELESEKRYLEKSNKHLEKILEATKAHSKHEVSQLNKIHAETIKILTTPTKAYNLRNRLVPLSSPEHLNGQHENIEVDDIQSEQPPPEMNELACEALTEELRLMQEQALRVQGQLDEEEAKNRKLLQQISKLEEQFTTMFGAERHSLLEEQQHLQERVGTLEQQLEDEQREMDMLRVEVRDLRVVLQSSDKELEAARTELQQQKAEHERETTDLSRSLISTQLQLDTVKLEWEQVLEKQRVLQDTYDTLQAEFQFELDQHTQQMQLKSRECSEMQTKINVTDQPSESERVCQSTSRSCHSQRKNTGVCVSSEPCLWDKVVPRCELNLKISQNLLLRMSSFVKMIFNLTLSSGCLCFQTPQTPCGFGSSLSQVLECQERELESRRSSMITMEVLLKELNAERTAKNQEIDRLKVTLMHTVPTSSQSSDGKFGSFPRTGSFGQFDSINRLKKPVCVCCRLQRNEVTLVQSQTCVQELTTELRNRCLELRDLRQKDHQQEKLQQSCPRYRFNPSGVLQEIEVLRKQVDHLTEENGKLLGHQNPKQKIEYLVKLKKEITRLQEVIEKKYFFKIKKKQQQKNIP